MPKKEDPDRKKRGGGSYDPTPSTPLPTPTNPGSYGDAGDDDKTKDPFSFSKPKKSPFDTTLPANKGGEDDASEIMKRFNI
ncbi:UNVERIFIED_ORG: hypothetical protein J2X79_002038 [Arthrobacter globiformis]|nr:hypothetical protein [Arthrobacter globiformis]